LAKFVLVLALACSIGLHWAFLQSLAWTSMLADNLLRDSLAQAVIHTFDGQHPCLLCKAIADGKKSEKKTDYAPYFKTLEFPPAAEDFALTIPARFAPTFSLKPSPNHRRRPRRAPPSSEFALVCFARWIAQVFLISESRPACGGVSQLQSLK
jgi:hypothetical protein